MARRFGILCSGQGGQSVAMLDHVVADAAFALAWQRFEAIRLQADGGLSLPVPPASQLGWAQLQQRPDLLFANHHAQPLIVAFGLATWCALAGRLPMPSLVAGYSVGELTACGVAQALAPDEAMRLVLARAAAMDHAALGTRQGMSAITGIAWASLTDELRAHRLHLAIDNGRDSCVVGGTGDDLLAFAAQAVGFQVRSLAVQVASHTPLMQAALPPWENALQQANWQRPRCPILSGVTANRMLQPHAMLPMLAQQVVAPIAWAKCMDAMVESGIDLMLELGPGNALARMMALRHPAIPVRSVADFRSLDAVAQWVEGQLESA